MKMKIYDYANRKYEVQLPDKKIKEISVCVITGDETVEVVMEDGEIVCFDSGFDRIADYDDGMYTVEGDRIKEFLNFVPSSGRTASYERMGKFEQEE